MTSHRMSILHFSTSDIVGGSARSAYRIHTGLRARGHRSRMLVGFRRSHDPDVQAVAPSRPLQLLDRAADRLTARLGYQYQYVPSSTRTARHPWIREADVIQLFNTHGGYFAQSLLSELARHAPIVWRLSDMWAFTGHCAYSGNCERWLAGCGSCPQPEAYPAVGRDRTAALYTLKEHLYRRLPMTVVVPSSWLETLAKQSPLLREHPIVRIPNGLELRELAPRSRELARRRFGLPHDARVILFPAHILDDNPRKGGDVLLQALVELGPRPGWTLALLGEGGLTWVDRSPIAVQRLGFQSAPDAVADAYAAADVVALPSVMENLPNTLIEALACGRAVVASDCGGMRDGVMHGVTGLLTRTGDPRELARALQELMEADERRATMEREARALFEREFTAERELDRFEALYSEVVVASATGAV
jgi:glycosyltransferase involved in cell wall biosynthesis